MAEEFQYPSSQSSSQISKEQKYQLLLPQLEALIKGEPDLIANFANTAALLKQFFNFWWVGFYLVRPALIQKVNHKTDELVLGPFQGPLACSRIPFGKGVCGAAWKKKQIILVPDVEKFPGHIACSSASRSEIVIPIFNSLGQVVGVLDVDSEHLNHFDEIDARELEKVTFLLSNSI